MPDHTAVDPASRPSPPTVSTPYCSVAELFLYHEPAHIACLLQTGNRPRPSRLAMLDAENPAGRCLLLIGQAAKAELDSVINSGKAYAIRDLPRLAESGRVRLRKLMADMWFVGCVERWWPGTQEPRSTHGWLAGGGGDSWAPGTPKGVSDALSVGEDLDRLRNGERLFGPVPGRVECRPSDRSVWLDGKRLDSGLDEVVYAYFAVLADEYPEPITFGKMGEKSAVLAGVNPNRLNLKIPLKLAALVKRTRGKGHVLELPD